MIILGYIAGFCIFGFSMSKLLYNRLLISFFFGIYGAILSVSRINLSTGDLPNYVIGFLDFDWSPYFLLSPAFWLIGRSIYYVLNDPQLTFLIMDFLILSLFRSSFNGKHGILVASLLLSFPFILGFTNIYRQLMATAFLLRAFSYELDKPNRLNLYFLLASLIHLTTIPMILVYYYVRLFRLYPTLMFIIGSGIIGLVIQFEILMKIVSAVGGTESRNATGPIYIILFCVFFVSTLFALKAKNSIPKDILLASFCFFLLGLFFLAVAPDSSGTRIIMISIIIQTYVLVYAAKHFNTRSSMIRLIVSLQVVLLAIPAIISPSAWHLLFGYQL